MEQIAYYKWVDDSILKQAVHEQSVQRTPGEAVHKNYRWTTGIKGIPSIPLFFFYYASSEEASFQNSKKAGALKFHIDHKRDCLLWELGRLVFRRQMLSPAAMSCWWLGQGVGGWWWAWAPGTGASQSWEVLGYQVLVPASTGQPPGTAH